MQIRVEAPVDLLVAECENFRDGVSIGTFLACHRPGVSGWRDVDRQRREKSFGEVIRG